MNISSEELIFLSGSVFLEFW